MSGEVPVYYRPIIAMENETLSAPTSEETKKRTSWVNENFDEEILTNQTEVPPVESDLESLHSGDEHVIATENVIKDQDITGPRNSEPAILTTEDRSGASVGGSTSEVQYDIKPGNSNGGNTSHRGLPPSSPSNSPKVQQGGGGGFIRLKRSTLRPLDDPTHYDLQVSITSREKHTVSKTDSYFTYQIETKVITAGSIPIIFTYLTVI